MQRERERKRERERESESECERERIRKRLHGEIETRINGKEGDRDRWKERQS